MRQSFASSRGTTTSSQELFQHCVIRHSFGEMQLQLAILFLEHPSRLSTDAPIPANLHFRQRRYRLLHAQDSNDL
ncbi:hypothetical protein OA2633_02396 [Oceanicaulis sp. HTCC2633]|nr:hypothetical protein OA2633_02396 [Oceanicaulis sp. HTCC2633]